MKKYLFLAFAALVSFSLFSCGDDDAADNGSHSEGGTKAFIGSWDMAADSYYSQIIFTEREFTYLYGDVDYEGNRFMRHKVVGSYTEKNGIVVLTPQKNYQPDYNNNNQIIEVPLDEDMKQPATVRISVLAGGKAIVIETQDEQGFMGERMLMTKQNAQVDVNSVQGRWIWYVGDTKNTRIYIEISGNKFDLIIPIYGERYQGTVSSGANGQLNFNVEKYLVCDNRGDTPYSDQLFKDWRDRNEEEMEWRRPHFYEEDGPHSFSLPFIVDGKVAYCTILGLTAQFEKL
ncbi:MAG: hypothetical protein MJZ43_06355 [Bacteroidaceae bacterium]|nr:hypothetical protein [Bacteroidaceae bacterium]